MGASVLSEGKLHPGFPSRKIFALVWGYCFFGIVIKVPVLVSPLTLPTLSRVPLETKGWGGSFVSGYHVPHSRVTPRIVTTDLDLTTRSRPVFRLQSLFETTIPRLLIRDSHRLLSPPSTRPVSLRHDESWKIASPIGHIVLRSTRNRGVRVGELIRMRIPSSSRRGAFGWMGRPGMSEPRQSVPLETDGYRYETERTPDRELFTKYINI